jgi:hypothetical protein
VTESPTHSQLRNPAARLSTALEKYLRHGGGGSGVAIDVWARVFELGEIQPVAKRQFQVAALLRELYDELQELRRRAKGTNILESRYSGPLDKVERAIAPSTLFTGANSAGQHLTPDVLQMVGTLADILDSDEGEAPANVVADVLTQLNELEAEIAAADISDEFRRVLLRLIDQIRFAIREYQVVGSRALISVYRRVLMDWQDIPRSHSVAAPDIRAHLRKILVGIGVVITVTNGVLGTVDSSLKLARDVRKEASLLAKEYELPGAVLAAPKERKQIPSTTSPST